MEQGEPRPTRRRVVVALFVLVNVAIAVAAIVLLASRTPALAPARAIDRYVSQGEDIPREEQVPGVPFLRRQDGVTYMRPEIVSADLRDKLQSFDEVWIVLQQMVLEASASGDTVRVQSISAPSVLVSKLGLKTGDEILSVDGLPLPRTFVDGVALHKNLCSRAWFAIKVRRAGEPVILTVYVQ